MEKKKGISPAAIVSTSIILLLLAVLAYYFATQHNQAPPDKQLANPASVNCIKQGGTLTIQTNGTGGQYGVCNFGSGYACEEWALFRGDCKKPGVRTTGYDTQAQAFCALVGGKTLAVPNATCTFPDGSVCNDDALFNGTCQRGQFK